MPLGMNWESSLREFRGAAAPSVASCIRGDELPDLSGNLTTIRKGGRTEQGERHRAHCLIFPRGAAYLRTEQSTDRSFWKLKRAWPIFKSFY